MFRLVYWPSVAEKQTGEDVYEFRVDFVVASVAGIFGGCILISFGICLWLLP